MTFFCFFFFLKPTRGFTPSADFKSPESRAREGKKGSSAEQKEVVVRTASTCTLAITSRLKKRKVRRKNSSSGSSFSSALMSQRQALSSLRSTGSELLYDLLYLPNTVTISYSGGNISMESKIISFGQVICSILARMV